MAYITKSGDTWDAIAKAVYGSEYRADALMEANRAHIGTFVFQAGVELNTPALEEARDGGCRRGNTRRAMIKTRSINLSVEYRKTAYSAASRPRRRKAGAQPRRRRGRRGPAHPLPPGARPAAQRPGAAVTLNATPLYVASTSKSRAATKTGTYYLYDGILIRGRYRITNTPSRVGKTPVGKNVTGWVDAADIGLSAGDASGSADPATDTADRPAGSVDEDAARGPERRSPGWWRA